MNRTILILTITLTTPAFSQTIYKCPKPDGTTMIQQMPCSAQGGGETLTVVPIKASGPGGLRESEMAYMKASTDRLEQQAQAAEVERQRQEALRIEKDKAKAAESQARATWYMGSAIMMNGRR